jgi:hypothetical protein
MSLSLSKSLRDLVDSKAPLLRAMDLADVTSKPSPNQWAKKEILGHLIDSASNNHQRFVRGQLEAELRFPGYQQEGWVKAQDYIASDWTILVDLWAAYNRHLAYVIGRIDEVHLNKPCRIGENAPVSLEYIIEDYIEHMKHHLAQLER